MKSHFIIQIICLLISTGCLGIPYLVAGYWPVALLFLAMVAFRIPMTKKSIFLSTSIFLSVFALLAAVGMLVSLSTPLMIIACIAALAWWDLANFRHSLVIGQPPETTLLLERDHLQSLGITVCAGLMLVFIGSYLDLRISFPGMVLLVVFAIGCLTYAMHSILKKNV
jgi:hypothetical protein